MPATVSHEAAKCPCTDDMLQDIGLILIPGFTSVKCAAGEVEFRNLAPTELAVCTEAARPGGVRVRDSDGTLVESLHKRGLLYLDVPIRPDDHVSIPPLEVRPLQIASVP